MSVAISSLTIDGFRSLRHLKLENLARVNLITGKNNSGKTSVLEALAIVASRGTIPLLCRLVQEREEDQLPSAPSVASVFRSLFTDFPFAQVPSAIELNATGGRGKFKVKIWHGWAQENRSADGAVWLSNPVEKLDLGKIPVLVKDFEPGERRITRLSGFNPVNNGMPEEPFFIFFVLVPSLRSYP